MLELVSGKRTEQQTHSEQIDGAVKEVLQYSEQEIARRRKILRKRSPAGGAGSVLCAACAAHTERDRFRGRIRLAVHSRLVVCPQLSRGAGKLRRGGIDRYIARADGVYEALTELREQGVVIRDAKARLSRTRLDDMFLFTELELTWEQEHITYLFTCQGTWRNGKVEWMQIYVPSTGYDGPAWLPQLSEAIATYNHG